MWGGIAATSHEPTPSPKPRSPVSLMDCRLGVQNFSRRDAARGASVLGVESAQQCGRVRPELLGERERVSWWRSEVRAPLDCLPLTSSTFWCLWPGHMQGWDSHPWYSFSEQPSRVFRLLERAEGSGVEAWAHLVTAGRGWGCAAACTPAGASALWRRSWLHPPCTDGHAGPAPPAAVPRSKQHGSGPLPLPGTPPWEVVGGPGTQHSQAGVARGTGGARQAGERRDPTTLPCPGPSPHLRMRPAPPGWAPAEHLSAQGPCQGHSLMPRLVGQPCTGAHLMVSVDLAKILHAEVGWAGALGSLLPDHCLGETVGVGMWQVVPTVCPEEDVCTSRPS